MNRHAGRFPVPRIQETGADVAESRCVLVIETAFTVFASSEPEALIAMFEWLEMRSALADT
jgi:hypothetical protein